MGRASFLLLLAAVTLGAAACAVRPADPVVVDPALLVGRGQILFEKNCHACHPDGKQGLGPSLEHPIDRAFAFRQVRDGWQLMPGFDVETLSDADVEAILAYVDTFQLRTPPEPEAPPPPPGEVGASLVRMIDSLGWEPPPESESP